MANSVTVQTLVDGPRNVVLKLDGLLDTSDLAYVVIVDPATLSDYNINNAKATKLRINKINFDVEDGLDVEMWWDAPTPLRFADFVGRGKVDAWRYGGIVNNATSPTGKIAISTQGWSTGAILSYTIVLELVKQGPG